MGGEDFILEPATHPEAKRKRRSLNFDMSHMTNLEHVIYQPSPEDMEFRFDASKLSMISRITSANIKGHKPTPNKQNTQNDRYRCNAKYIVLIWEMI